MVVLDEPPVAVVHAEDLDVVHILEEGLAHAPDGGVEPLTVPAAGEQAHSGLAFHMAVLLVKRDFKFTVASPIIAEPRQNCNPGLEALSIKNPPPPGGRGAEWIKEGGFFSCPRRPALERRGSAV